MDARVPVKALSQQVFVLRADGKQRWHPGAIPSWTGCFPLGAPSFCSPKGLWFNLAPAPACHAATKEARKKFWEAYSAFAAAFREAAEKLKAGYPCGIEGTEGDCWLLFPRGAGCQASTSTMSRASSRRLKRRGTPSSAWPSSLIWEQPRSKARCRCSP